MTVHFSKGLPQAAPIAYQPFAERRPTGLYAAFGKRLLDISLVILLAPIAIPIVLILAACIAVDGSNPFYSQLRTNADGSKFRMWKLRSMVMGADELLESYLAANPDERRVWDAVQKLENDPRITPFGRLLRQSSLDELPQLWNVLRGEMSIIGPRPMTPDQEHLYPGPFYFGARPGMTGPWQVSDRNDSMFKDRAVHDFRYRREMSLWTDIRLLVATAVVVFKCTGR